MGLDEDTGEEYLEGGDGGWKTCIGVRIKSNGGWSVGRA